MNPHFDDDLVGWSTWFEREGSKFEVIRNPAQSYRGGHALSIQTGSAGAAVWQELPWSVKAGDKVPVSICARSPTGGGAVMAMLQRSSPGYDILGSAFVCELGATGWTHCQGEATVAFVS
jgi:hypothetical protein